MDAKKEEIGTLDSGLVTKEIVAISSTKKLPTAKSYLDFLNYSKQREEYIATGKGQIELRAIAKEIDDERTKKDLTNVTILEVGCLNGVAMKILKQEYGIHNIEGMDINPYSPKMCMSHGTKCVEKDVMDLNKKYDMIFMQHLDDKDHDFLAQVITKCLGHVKKKVIVVLNIFNDKEATNIVKEVPNENHRYIKNIVKYQLGRTHYKVWVIVFYPKDTKQKKGDQNGNSYRR